MSTKLFNEVVTCNCCAQCSENFCCCPEVMFSLGFYQMVKPLCQLALSCDHPELGNVQRISEKYWKFTWALCRRLIPKSGLGKGEVSSNRKPEHNDTTKVMCRNLQCTAFSFLCEEVTYKRARKVCICFFFQLRQKVDDLQGATSVIYILPCLFASEVTASKLQAFSFHVQKLSVMCYPSNLGCATKTSVPGPAVQWPEQHLLKEDQLFLKMFYVKHPEMQAPKGHLWPKNLFSAEKRWKVFCLGFSKGIWILGHCEDQFV